MSDFRGPPQDRFGPPQQRIVDLEEISFYGRRDLDTKLSMVEDTIVINKPATRDGTSTLEEIFVKIEKSKI